MRRRPSPALSAVRPATTVAVADARRRGPHAVVSWAIALVLAAAPAFAQTTAADADDPLRRPLARDTTRSATRTTPSKLAPGLRGGIDPSQPVAPAADPLARPDDTLTTSPAVDTDPLALEPIGRPATPAAASTGTTARAPGAPAATGSGTRLDTITGRPLVLAPTGAPRGPVDPVARTGTVRNGGPTATEPAIQPRPRDLLAAEREEGRTADDTYAPLGLRTGGFTWLPAVEAATGWTSNLQGRVGGTPAALWRINPELVGRSDWSRHSLQIELRGGYSANFVDHDYDKPTFQGVVRGRVDLGDQTRMDLRAGWSHDRQSSSSLDNPAGTVVPATVDTKTASVGLTRDVGLLALTLRGDVERADYSGGTTTSGAALGADVQNNTRGTAALRAAWGSAGSLRPFAEVQVSKRDYDDALVSGSPRDSTGAAIKAGLLADLGPTLRGEVSTGFGVERPDRGTLPDMSGWLLDGALVWSPTRLTVVRLDAKTSFEPTTLATTSGATVRTVGVTVDHALRRDLVASAGVVLTDKRYADLSLRENDVVLSSGLTYKIDRNVHTFVKGSLQRFTSSNAGSDYGTATIMVGVRLQR